jgi:hypothetical protein
LFPWASWANSFAFGQHTSAISSPESVRPAYANSGVSVFNGAFENPASWTTAPAGSVEHSQPAWYYSLSGTIVGALSNGQVLSAAITFSTKISKGEELSSVASLAVGAGSVLVPEPETLALLATGLLGLAVLVRRRLVAER